MYQTIKYEVKNNIGNTIEVRFNTKFALDEYGTIIALNQSVPNQATLTYGNGSTVKSEKPEVHTGGVGLFKYDEKTGKAFCLLPMAVRKSHGLGTGRRKMGIFLCWKLKNG